MSKESTKMKSRQLVHDNIVKTLKTVYDPEIPVNIYELGLIYSIKINDEGKVTIVMTLTSPMCPIADLMPDQVERKLKEIDNVTDVDVQLVWDPPWNPEMMSEEAKLELNMM